MSDINSANFINYDSTLVAELFLKLNKEGQRLALGYIRYLASSKNYSLAEDNTANKNVNNDEDNKENRVVPPKKKRGRPRKIWPEDEIKAAANVVKRKGRRPIPKPDGVPEVIVQKKRPGRPRKIIQDSAPALMTADTHEDPVIRKRGRPRKYPLNVAPVIETLQYIEEPLNKKRGRPHKNSSDTAPAQDIIPD